MFVNRPYTLFRSNPYYQFKSNQIKSLFRTNAGQVMHITCLFEGSPLKISVHIYIL